MEKIIWIIEEDKNDLQDIQRKINAFGGIRAMCIFTNQMLKKIIEERLNQDDLLSTPSLILINYNMTTKDTSILEMLKMHSKLAGVPYFFIIKSA